MKHPPKKLNQIEYLKMRIKMLEKRIDMFEKERKERINDLKIRCKLTDEALRRIQ